MSPERSSRSWLLHPNVRENEACCVRGQTLGWQRDPASLAKAAGREVCGLGAGLASPPGQDATIPRSRFLVQTSSRPTLTTLRRRTRAL